MTWQDDIDRGGGRRGGGRKRWNKKVEILVGIIKDNSTERKTQNDMDENENEKGGWV